MKAEKVTVSMPHYMVEDIDELAEDIGISRSEVIQDILREVLRNEGMMNIIYPLEKEEEEPEEEEGEGEET